MGEWTRAMSDWENPFSRSLSRAAAAFFLLPMHPI